MTKRLIKNQFTHMTESEYTALYYTLKDTRKCELKKMLLKFGINIKMKCKNDYIIELIHCIDDMHNTDDESELFFN